MFFITLLEQFEKNDKTVDYGIIKPVCFFQSLDDCFNAFGSHFSEFNIKGYDYICIEEINPGKNIQVKSRTLYAINETINAFFETDDILPNDYCFAFSKKIGGNSNG